MVAQASQLLSAKTSVIIIRDLGHASHTFMLFYYSKLIRLCVRFFHVLSFQSPEKKISLQGSILSESANDKTSRTFKIRPKGSKRMYHLKAETEGSCHDWMQAVCMAKAAGARTDQSEACILQ